MKARIGWKALARYLAGESTNQERAAVEAWARSSDRNEAVLASARQAWEAAESDHTAFDTERAWKSLTGRMAGLDMVHGSGRVESQSGWRRPAVWVPALMAAAVAFLLLVPALRRGELEAPSRIVATGPANVTTVHLDDGSVVRLAPNTELKVSVNGKREAWLKGTAFFAIAKRADDPFVVHTAAGDARVLGTRFELTSAGRAVRLVVFEGRVALTAKGASEVVEAGQISSAEPGHAPSVPQSADVQRLTPWLDGILIFQATPLSAVAAELQREYGVQVQLTNQALSARTVSAVFEHKPLETVVAAICRVADATCEINDTAVIIRP